MKPRAGLRIFSNAERGVFTQDELNTATSFVEEMEPTDTAYDIIRRLSDKVHADPYWGPRIKVTVSPIPGTNQVREWTFHCTVQPDANQRFPFKYATIVTTNALGKMLGFDFRPLQYVLPVQTPQDLIQDRMRRLNLLKYGRTIPPIDIFSPPIILLYSNLVEPSAVGDVMAPIMEIIPTASLSRADVVGNAATNTQKMYRPKMLQFRNIQANEIRELEFDMRTPTGRRVSVNSETQRPSESTGGTIIELKLRPKKPSMSSAEGDRNPYRGDWQRDRIAQIM